MYYKIAIFLFIQFWWQCSFAQSRLDWKIRGNELMQDGMYREALGEYLSFIKEWPYDAEVLTNTGICCFFLNDLAGAERYLYQSFMAKDDPAPSTYLYLGRLNHTKLEFEIAADFYKKYLRKISLDHPNRSNVKDDIARCANGLLIRRSETPIQVLPLGEVVNSDADDFSAIISPGHFGRLYFSSNRRVNEESDRSDYDIFSTEWQKGNWSLPEPLSHFINSSNHEMPLGFDEAGEVLYFFRGDNLSEGNVLADTFKQNAVERTLLFSPAHTPLNPLHGDIAPFFFNDSILLFASRRPGGYGGLDLYWSILSEGEWSVPKNLGPTINSIYDETDPVLANDGRTLYFSTNSVKKSFGGLDIVKARYLDHLQQWSEPVNLGLPINSAEADGKLQLSKDGKRAFFSSARKSGLGGRDLYVAVFDPPLAEQKRVSMPVAFPLVPSFYADIVNVSESDALAPEQMLERIEVLELKPMAFQPSGPFPLETVRQLDLLIAVLKIFPETRLSVAVHMSSTMANAKKALETMDHLEAYFKSASAPAASYSFRWAGSISDAMAGETAQSNFFTVYFSNTGHLPFEVHRRNNPSATPNSALFHNMMENLFYQVAVPLPKEPDHTLLTSLYGSYPDGMVVSYPGTGQRFFNIGTYLTHATAAQWAGIIRQNGYHEASITAYLKGWPVSREEAAELTSEFPDLQNFLEN